MVPLVVTLRTFLETGPETYSLHILIYVHKIIPETLDNPLDDGLWLNI